MAWVCLPAFLPLAALSPWKFSTHTKYAKFKKASRLWSIGGNFLQSPIFPLLPVTPSHLSAPRTPFFYPHRNIAITPTLTMCSNLPGSWCNLFPWGQARESSFRKRSKSSNRVRTRTLLQLFGYPAFHWVKKPGLPLCPVCRSVPAKSLFAALHQDYPQVIVNLGEKSKQKPQILEHSETFTKFICNPSKGQYPSYPNFKWKVKTQATSSWALKHSWSLSAAPQ